MEKSIVDNSTPVERTVRIAGSGIRETFRTVAQTWNQLQDEIRAKFSTFDISKMRAALGNKTTLEHPSAALPTANFTLFLTPKKTKSGVDIDDMSHKELRSTISSLIKTSLTESNGEAKDYFNQGQNYTRKSTKDLRSLLAGWFKGHATVDVKNFTAQELTGNTVKEITPTIAEEMPEVTLSNLLAMANLLHQDEGDFNKKGWLGKAIEDLEEAVAGTKYDNEAEIRAAEDKILRELEDGF